jgi:hypothetical protein
LKKLLKIKLKKRFANLQNFGKLETPIPHRTVSTTGIKKNQNSFFSIFKKKGEKETHSNFQHAKLERLAEKKAFIQNLRNFASFNNCFEKQRKDRAFY